MKAFSRRTGAAFAVTAALAFMPVAGFADEPAQPTPPSGENIKVLDLYNLTDVHGHIAPYVKKGKNGKPDQVREAGLAAMACYLKKAEGEHPDSSFTLLGDNIGASPIESGYEYDNPTIAALNLLKPLGSTIGNHELDLGSAVFRTRLAGGKLPSGEGNFVAPNFPYLGMNVVGLDELKPYVIWTAPDSGLKVAFLGAIAEDVPFKLNPELIKDLSFKDPISMINTTAKELKDQGKADIVIAMLDDDVKKNLPLMGKYVDGLMGGDTHVPYAFTMNAGSEGNKLSGVASGSYTDNLGLLKVYYDTKEKKVVYSQAENISAADVFKCGEDPAVKAVVDKALAGAKAYKDKVVASGFTADFFRGVHLVDGQPEPGANRGVESSLGDLVADALRAAVVLDGKEADFGLVNAGGLRADFPAKTANNGTVTYGMVYAVAPFSNEVGYIKLKGADFKEALEQQWKPADSTQNSRPMLKLGISGNITYTYDASKPYGERITSVLLNGKPMDMDKVYTVASISFLLAGGDSFPALTKGTKPVLTGELDRDAIARYLKAHTDVKPRAMKSSVGVTVPGEVAANSKFTVDLRGLDFTEGPSIYDKVVVSFAGKSETVDIDNSLADLARVRTDGPGAAQVSFETAGLECMPEGGFPINVFIPVDGKNVPLVTDVNNIRVKVTGLPVCAAKPVPAKPGLANTGIDSTVLGLIALGFLTMGGASVLASRRMR